MEEFGYNTLSSLSAERKEKLDEAIVREIFDFSVCFIMESKVCGSGTLVRVNGKFGILTAAHVVEQFTGYKKRNVGLNKPIKATGVHQMTLKLKEDVACSYSLEIIGEQAQQHRE